MDRRIFAGKQRRPGGTGRRFATVLALLALAWALGLAWFVATLPEPLASLPLRQVDGIVVLTGSGGRIDQGIRALRGGLGARMLITGVNPSIAPGTLRNALGSASELFDCCIDLGRQAANTAGNAREAREWAERHGFRSLEVITTDLHMRRSMLEFRRAMPELTLYPHPIRGRRSLSAVAAEYSKFLIAQIRSWVR